MVSLLRLPFSSGRRFQMSLFRFTALTSVCLMASPARAALSGETHARKGAHHGTAQRGTVHHTAALPAAQAAAPARKPVSHGNIRASGDETVAVSGHRAVSRGPDNVIGQAVFRQFTPGVSAYKALDRLPGVSFSSTDALGIDTWGSSIYVRGFFMDQLGITLDGIPLNDQTYETQNGVNLIQAVISDDIEHATLSTGPGGVSVPSTSTLGGTIQFETSDPKDRAGGKVSQGFGSYASYRTYLRGDTGKLNATGTKAMVSYSRSDEKKWMGRGHQFQQQVDSKLVQPIGNDSMMKAFFNWSQLQEWGYQDTSLSMIRTMGWRVPHLYPDYAKAYNYAASLQDGGTPTLPVPDEVSSNSQQPYLYDAGQNEIDYTGGLRFDLALTDHLRWKSMLYGQSMTGYYSYSDYDYASPDTGAPFSEAVWQVRQERVGGSTGLEYKIARHTIDAGVWYENNNQAADVYWYNEPALGQGAPLKTVGPYTTYGPAFQRGYGMAWRTNNFTWHLEDTWRPLKNLRVTAGFKSMVTGTAGGGYYNNPDYTGADKLPVGTMTASAAFLPHVGASWFFLPHHELYFDLAENMRTYQVLPNGGGNSLWAVQDQATFRDLQNSVKPEKDWVYAVGYRYSDKLIQASIDGYHADARHRLMAATLGTITAPVSSVIQSRVSIYGVDASTTLTPVKGLAIYNSVSYNHGTYGNNLDASDGFYHMKGRKLVNYPQFMYKANLSYTWHGVEAHFDVHYYSKRYFSFTNDTSVPGYWLASTGARWNLGKIGFARNMFLDFNVYNLFNSKYVSMMGQNGNPISGDYQSLERGAVRQYFGTVSAEF
ncbi:TonB-dependent receptor plug domain-containing protein [Acetobacter sp. AN02]|uniref:TonB-dependent receptor n=1 Tax=Acetobacter sp. AN02 TaxID=2894186 RepID=UPI0024344DBE|nr:TonB-dependent receptor [Acetobacter sp. AN02]MDG6095599.1 TonB-dependent receptor plug domain-containing protein [Acetobacter sp. AN02]